MKDYKTWYDVAKDQGSIICLDEVQMAFSNRRWSRYSSTLATEVMMYTRKMQSVQMYCSPSINNVDSRIRQIVEILVTVRKIGIKAFQCILWTIKQKSLCIVNLFQCGEQDDILS